jgi:C1A family cysteine protease
MRTALASGLGIIAGFSVPTSFIDGSWNPATEVLPLPGPNDGFVGGHCICITGYDFTRADFPEPFFWVDNSWGTNWGVGGRFRMAWDWFDPGRGLASDMWVIQAAT